VDSDTHVRLAERLLQTTDGDLGALPFSLFPQIDRSPAYLHRMFAHPFHQFPLISHVATATLWCGDGTERDVPEHDFEYVRRRLSEEIDRIRGHIAKWTSVDDLFSKGRVPLSDSAAVAFASHAYQDVFNNPVQAFAPWSPYPCGAWALWEQVGPIDFRRRLYLQENIDSLRADLFSRPDWNARFSTEAIVEAIVRRTAHYSVVPVDESIVIMACQQLGVVPRGANQDEVREAIEFLSWHEDVLGGLIVEYSK
jgi:hypothetical protein